MCSSPPSPPEFDGFLGASDRVDSGAPGVILLRARYREDRFSAALFDTHHIQRPDTLSSARDRRLAEFLAGRMLAVRAMDLLALPMDTVVQAPDRRPLFPHGLSGSISHARGFVACLVTRDADVGVDIEPILTETAMAAVWASVLTDTDRALLGGHDPRLVSALFSAKETLFKALYPSVGRIFGFEAASLTALPGQSGLTLRLTETLCAALPKGRCFGIRAQFATDHVLTWLIHRPDNGT